MTRRGAGCRPASSSGARVVPLLERCWPAVKELATTLYFKGTASHQDVCTALGLPAGDDGGPGSLGLAMIRAGGVPGSFSVGLAAV